MDFIEENKALEDAFAEKEISNLRISNYIKGQRWVTLKGDFTSGELRDIADQIEEAYNKAFNKK